MVKSLVRTFFWLMLLFISTQDAYAQIDTDGDGLLDLVDVPGFDPNQSGLAHFSFREIEDLDGASRLRNLGGLVLYDNAITSIESGDFEGLSNLQTLELAFNQIAGIESGAFNGTFRGDLDGLGGVAFADFITMAGNFGNSPADYDDGDFDKDGLVGFQDFLLLAGNFGQGGGFTADMDIAAVPEPSSVALLVVAIGFLVARVNDGVR